MLELRCTPAMKPGVHDGPQPSIVSSECSSRRSRPTGQDAACPQAARGGWRSVQPGSACFRWTKVKVSPRIEIGVAIA